jgi:mannose-6-phosphate isomerase-like protein (cupin superfamily)
MNNVDYLPKLDEAVAELVARPATHNLIDTLKQQLPNTSEPFVWSAIDLQSITTPLPGNIKSCWIFVLKKDAGSGCHYHPNSIQHMVMIEGEGSSKVGSSSRRMKLFRKEGSSLADTWYVIPEGVPHEFFPKRKDVVVVSFHTCAADELEEISCDSKAARHYES